MGMCSVQELFFWLGGLRKDRFFCVINVFIFVTEKSLTFKNRKYRRKTEKKQIYLTSQRLYVMYCLYRLNGSN